MILWQELRDQVGNTVSSGLDLTGEILRTGVPLARSALAQAPTIINTTRQVSTKKANNIFQLSMESTYLMLLSSQALDTLNSDQNRARVTEIAGVGTRVASDASRVAR